MINLPSTIGKYQLLEFLGGGMSHVYRAHDTVIDRPVVVKILTADADADAKARFLQEARLAGNIQHPNIVSVYDYGEIDGSPFIVMEFLRGEDLRAAISAGHFRSMEHRLQVALDIAHALDHVHSKGIVHRDIKPENVHIDLQGKVKLMDFGIAKTADLSLTRTGLAMGTPYYMSPEQVTGKPATVLVDIYAFGLLLFEILTGKRGVGGDSMESVFFQILNVPVDDQLMVNAGVNPQIRQVVLRATAKPPEQRPQSFGALCDELRAGMNPAATVAPSYTLPMQVPPPPPRVVPTAVVSTPAKKSSAGLWIGIAALIAIAIGAGAWWMLRPGPSVPGMVYISGGGFLAGAEKKSVALPPFFMDEAEVTNADFGEYCRASGCTAPAGDAQLPVVNVTVEQARAYAKWRGKRLPTSMEWERVARGTAGALFPWGDQSDASKANVADNTSVGRHALMPARSFAAYPAFQMIGNAWEMVDDKVTPSAAAVDQFATLLTPAPTASEPWISIRGGSYTERLSPALSYDVGFIPERFSSPLIGFRCAKDP